jgi:anti-sigma factor RsiW
MRATEGNMKRCAGMENKLIECLDGRAKPAERHALEQHLAACAVCRARAEGFRILWDALDDLPVLSPSPAFDASLRARIAAEPARRRYWDWLPSPRLAFAATALVAITVWMVSTQHVAPDQTTMETTTSSNVSEEANFRMIRDLPVLENYDVLSKFDALSELPASPAAAPGEVTKETR